MNLLGIVALSILAVGYARDWDIGVREIFCQGGR